MAIGLFSVVQLSKILDVEQKKGLMMTNKKYKRSLKISENRKLFSMSINISLLKL